VTLNVVGPGDETEVLIGLDPDVQRRIRMLGRLDDGQKASQLAAADIYVAPNTMGESFGIVLLEAMAAGTAVLASDLMAFRRVLDQGSAGMTFAVDDPEDLATKALELLDNRELRDELAAAGRRRVAGFDWEHIAQRILAVYDSVRVPGEKVRVDLRGQLVGRLAGRSSASSDRRGPTDRPRGGSGR